MSNKTIFKRIIDREIPAQILYEDDDCLAFRDVNPQAPVHFLVIPKKEIVSVDELTSEDEGLVGRMFLAIQRIAKQEGLVNGYRVVANCGPDGCQTVPHLHFHVIGGRQMGWPPG